MAELFGKDVRTVNEHIQNVFKERELVKNSVIRNFRITAADGKNYDTNFYNLDVIISVGYRVKSNEGTHFRIWATQTLRNHILQGFTVNQKRLKQTGITEFQQALKLIESTIQSNDISNSEAKGLLDVVTRYADTWLLLQQYDEKTVPEPKTKHTPRYQLTIKTAQEAIAELKQNLISKKEASELFGNEREEMLRSILDTLYQTFDEKELYPSVEDKAAHILYLIIKDHPFSDGNKRIASFLFIVFLQQNNALLGSNGQQKFNNNALVALALLVAQSDPADKDTMIRLIMNLIQ
jgi:death-on-curing family protein